MVCRQPGFDQPQAIMIYIQYVYVLCYTLAYRYPFQMNYFIFKRRISLAQSLSQPTTERKLLLIERFLQFLIRKRYLYISNLDVKNGITKKMKEKEIMTWNLIIKVVHWPNNTFYDWLYNIFFHYCITPDTMCAFSSLDLTFYY